MPVAPTVGSPAGPSRCHPLNARHTAASSFLPPPRQPRYTAGMDGPFTAGVLSYGAAQLMNAMFERLQALGPIVAAPGSIGLTVSQDATGVMIANEPDNFWVQITSTSAPTSTTVAANIAAGLTTFAPASMLGILVGVPLTFSDGTNSETTPVTDVSGTKAKAKFVNSYTGPVTITGMLLSGAYSWSEVFRPTPITWQINPQGLSGDNGVATGLPNLPIFEANGNNAVPLNTVARAWWSESDQSFLFEYEAISNSEFVRITYTNSQASITAGVGVTITPDSMDGIFVGANLTFFAGTSFETGIPVISVTATTFTVTLSKNYTGPVKITGARTSIGFGRIAYPAVWSSWQSVADGTAGGQSVWLVPGNQRVAPYDATTGWGPLILYPFDDYFVEGDAAGGHVYYQARQVDTLSGVPLFAGVQFVPDASPVQHGVVNTTTQEFRGHKAIYGNFMVTNLNNYIPPGAPGYPSGSLAQTAAGVPLDGIQFDNSAGDALMNLYGTGSINFLPGVLYGSVRVFGSGEFVSTTNPGDPCNGSIVHRLVSTATGSWYSIQDGNGLHDGNGGTGLQITGAAGDIFYGGLFISPGASPVSVANGGTGKTTLTLNGVLYGKSTSPVGVTAAGTSGQLLVAGSAPAFVTMSGDATLTGTGVLTLVNTAVAPATYPYATVTVDSKGRITTASAGATPATGTGTLNTVPKVTNATGPVYGDSSITDDGTTVLITGRYPSQTGGQTNSEVWGAGATTAGPNSVVLGQGASAGGTTAQTSVVIGQGASISGTHGQGNVLIGQGASIIGYSSVVLGALSSVTGDVNGAVLIGYNSTTSSANSVVIGGGQSSVGTVCIGTNNTISAGARGITIGQANTVTDDFSCVLGTAGSSQGQGGIVWCGHVNDPFLVLSRADSTTNGEPVAVFGSTWASNTHASRKGRGYLSACDFTGTNREFVRWESDGTVARGGFFAVTAVAQQTGDVATALVNYGLLTSPSYGTQGRATAQTAANASVATVTVGAADGSFLVSANVLITTSVTHSFTATCTYTDEGGTSRVLTLNFSQLTGAFVTALTNVLGASAYEGVPVHIRAKAATTITIATTGTFTVVTYNVEGHITQIA